MHSIHLHFSQVCGLLTTSVPHCLQIVAYAGEDIDLEVEALDELGQLTAVSLRLISGTVQQVSGWGRKSEISNSVLKKLCTFTIEWDFLPGIFFTSPSFVKF